MTPETCFPQRDLCPGLDQRGTGEARNSGQTTATPPRATTSPVPSGRTPTERSFRDLWGKGGAQGPKDTTCYPHTQLQGNSHNCFSETLHQGEGRKSPGPQQEAPVWWAALPGQVPRERDSLSPGLLLFTLFLTKRVAAWLNESRGEGQEEHRGSVIPGGGVWGRGCLCSSSVREAVLYRG